MDMNEDGINVIKKFEGKWLSFYKDPVGIKTIGYGFACHTDVNKPKCNEIEKRGGKITDPEADELLRSRLELEFVPCVRESLKVQLNNNQFSAIVSLAMNVGCPTIKISNLIKRLNAGDDPIKVATDEFPRWNKAGGSVLKGLVKRRNAEIELFRSASNSSNLLPPNGVNRQFDASDVTKNGYPNQNINAASGKQRPMVTNTGIFDFYAYDAYVAKLRGYKECNAGGIIGQCMKIITYAPAMKQVNAQCMKSACYARL